jgi:putative ABC transport system permease protein
VKTLRQVAVAEASLLGKMQLLMILVTVVVFFAASVSIMSTMGANVLERREEIGLMKAIGATRNNIKIFYIAEALLIGCAGGAAGFLLGYLFTQAVSWGAFNSFITFPLYLSLLSIGAGLIISLVASHFPVSDALKYNPAVILREE